MRLVNGHCQVGSGWGFAGRYAACEQVSRCFQTQAPYTPYSNWILFQSVLRFAVLPDELLDCGPPLPPVSIRFEVRGASRLTHKWPSTLWRERVSIRFEVRGASRPTTTPTPEPTPTPFQSALRFAVLPDFKEGRFAKWLRRVSIRFKVRGGFRRAVSPPAGGGELVSIRFKVRGGFRPYPLARRPDKPCCGGFTHHPSSPPPTRGQNLS